MAALAVAAILAGHGPLLRMLSWPLVDEQAPGEAALRCLHGNEYGAEGDPTLDESVQWCREAPGRRILLLEPRPHRVVQQQIVPSFDEMVRRELIARGVRGAAIVTVPGKAGNDWEKARLLGAWLQQNPTAEVLLVCDRFHSGRLRYVLDSVLGRELAGRAGSAPWPIPATIRPAGGAAGRGSRT